MNKQYIFEDNFYHGWDLAEWPNAEVATVLDVIPASSDTVESEGRGRWSSIEYSTLEKN